MPSVAHGMGLDKRIGIGFLNTGPGYGGSCFPKDTEALVYAAASHQLDLSLVKALIKSNENRKIQMVQKIVKACGGSLQEKTIGILGITFKADTDDVRESPSLVILPALQRKGATLNVYDPQGMPSGERLLPDIHWCPYAYEAAAGADALVILTEWRLFRELDFARLKKLMKTPLLIDFRNLYAPEVVREAGFVYVSLGRA
jgi:UDPglucose 6-dehydrogenase